MDLRPLLTNPIFQDLWLAYEEVPQLIVVFIQYNNIQSHSFPRQFVVLMGLSVPGMGISITFLHAVWMVRSGVLVAFGSPFSVFRIKGMIDKNDVLLALRGVLTLVIGLFTLALIGIMTTPFLGSASTYHKMATDSGAAVFIALKMGLTLMILTFSSFLLFLVGVICQRKINSHTYVALAVLAVVLCAWRCYDFLDSYLWNYIPIE